MKRLAVSMIVLVLSAGCVMVNFVPMRQSGAIAKISGQKYAMFISGRTEKKHIENIKIAYGVLAENGFSPRNILIFDATGNQSRPYPVNAPADAGSIRLGFRYLANKIGPDDLFLFYVTDHGYLDEKLLMSDEPSAVRSKAFRRQSIAGIGLIGRDLEELEIAACVDKIHPNIGIFIFTQCYGGSFARRLSGMNRVTIAPTHYGNCDSHAFTQAFFKSFRLRSCADLDGDKRISLREAFNYASRCGRSIKTFLRPPLMIYGVNREVFLDE